MEQALHQLFLPLLTFRAALCQLDDHSHVTCCQDGLQTLEQLIKQLLELQRVRDSQKEVLMRIQTYILWPAGGVITYQFVLGRGCS